MALRAIKRNFTGGEVSETIPSRDDLAKYETSCREVTNFTIQLHGGVRFRQGFQFIEEALGECVLFPFEFNTEEEDIYILVFSDKKIRVIQDAGYVLNGGIPVEIASPYLESEISEIQIAQIGDIVYLVHSNHSQKKLSRYSHTNWVLEDLSFSTSVAAPTGGNGAWQGDEGTATIYYVITAVNEKGEESVASAEIPVTNARLPDSWIEGNYVQLTWSTVPENVTYNIYKEDAGYYGLVGVATNGTVFEDRNYTPDVYDTPPIHRNPYSSGNYPSAVAIHQQRLWFGGSNENPATFNASQTANHENFNKSQPIKDDDALEFTVSSGQIDQIKWLLPFGDLLLGTAGTEFVISGAEAKALTSTNVKADPQSFWGSSNLRPIVVGNSVLLVQRQGSIIRDLFYTLEKNGYDTSNLSVLATHLFENHKIVSWAYQENPDSILWAVRDDGILLGMTYLKEHQIWGWHKHETDGEFENVCVVGGDDADRLYCVVKREINGSTKRYIEKLVPRWQDEEGIEAAFYVDSGLKNEGRLVEDIVYSNPLGVRVTSHGYETGDKVLFTDISGASEWQNVFTITKADVNNFTVDGLDGGLLSELTIGNIFVWGQISSVSGLSHLEGKEVAVLLDGSPYTLTVSGGSVSFPSGKKGYRVIVGLPYRGVLAPLPFEYDAQGGTSQGMQRGFGRVQLRLNDSVGGKAGVGGLGETVDTLTMDDLIYAQTGWGQPIQPYTGVKEISPQGGFGADHTIYVLQDQPLPFNVLSILAEVEFGEID